MPELPELSFEQFLMSLATAAMVHLGEVPHPETKKKAVDLPLAKQNIDILGMLRDRTKGNLSEGEQKLLDAMLGQLRMQYVSATGK
jgi:uncharacterized iron-regulated protein